MKKFWICTLCILFLCSLLPVSAAGPETNAKAVLLMEKTTGEVLYEEHAHDQLEPASVTKVMTMLLIMEALDQGQITKETMVPVSAAAAGMGGSQVYMKEGESFSVHDMLKAIAVASGNDASVAMAEYLAGSEDAFVEKMNAKAKELGMNDTIFMNCTGLPAEGHITSAYDIALMSRELILHHPDIRTYTTIWMDTLRDGTFQLSNTNKLIRFYDGATGLKTGSTDSALYCVSATAEKEGMELIAVVLGSPTSQDRFETAKALLSYGFAGFSLVTAAPSEPLSPIPVTLGTQPTVQPVLTKETKLLLPKEDAGKLTTTLSLQDTIEAPVAKGQEIGTLTVLVDGKAKETIPIAAQEEVPRLSLWQVYTALLSLLFCSQ
ncbi:MAG: D-alanyl-D-alanine carboxypeptidase family protein [Evtepia sp.]|uniref:D-alanyl-D-alanine carboxypeptidase family protein n=1 Tax=Evtepia sp. TaxID=2773933 RepID=UPI002A7615AA|nr:D-alanyl-D-alanine carboxypeptidase family protein [Evtepia sp.]MDY3013805.1 D-alanyl-D-alanine carboxypeptidase family protein [Evtepia sp.]